MLAEVADAQRQYADTIAANEEAKESIAAQFQSWFGFGELAKARKANKEKETEISRLQKELADAKANLSAMKQQFDRQMKQVRNGHQLEVDAAVKRAEQAEKERDSLKVTVASQRKQLREQHRLLHPELYRLSSGAELDSYRFTGKYGIVDGMIIWTKVGNIEHRAISHNLDPAKFRAYQAEELTIEQLVNSVFPANEQVNDEQINLLGTALELLSGGAATPHVGTGSGGSSSDLRWDGKDNESGFRSKRR